jgi:hypothetical protein
MDTGLTGTPRTKLLHLCLFIAALACQTMAAEPPASTSAIDFPGVNWKDRLTEDGLWSKGGWQRDGATLSIPKGPSFCAFPEKLSAAAIRVRFRYDGPGGSFIDLILRSDGRPSKVRYVATTFIAKEDDHGVSMVVRFQDPEGKHGPLGGKGKLASLKPGDEHTLEFYAQGDHLAYYLDGQLVVSLHDSKLTEGQTCLFTGNQVHFLSVETAELPKAPALAGGPVPSSPPIARSLPSSTPRPLSNLPPATAMVSPTPPLQPPRGLPPGFETPTGSSAQTGRAPASTTPAGSPTPTADDVRNVPTVDPYQLARNSFAYEGKVVKLKFTARVYELTHENGKSRGQVGVRIGRTWYNTTVMFPTEKDSWFMKFSNEVSGPYFVYARLSSGGSPFVATILGKEVQSGPKGPEIVW